MNSQDSLITEIGDGSSRPFSWSIKGGGSLKSKIKDYLDSVKGMSSSENWREMDPIVIIVKGEKASYEVKIQTWFSKIMKINFGGGKPGGPDYKIFSRLDFNVEGAEKEVETNLGEQYRLMATLTNIGIEFLNEAHKNNISLEEFNIYAKPDNDTETSDINSRRGKMYLEFVKKNLNKLNFKVTVQQVNVGGDGSSIRMRGGTWTSSSGPIPGAYYNESTSFKKFSDFVCEEEDMTTFLKTQSKDPKQPVDKKKEEEIEKYRDERLKVCPRCGKREGDCECSEKDFYSTVNAYRIPKGVEVYVKEMKNLVSLEKFHINEKKEQEEFKHTFSMTPSEWKAWEKKNKNKYQFHHVKQDLYWDVYTDDDMHILTYDYDTGKVHTDEPENFLETN
jgi:hypothetical protein